MPHLERNNEMTTDLITQFPDINKILRESVNLGSVRDVFQMYPTIGNKRRIRRESSGRQDVVQCAELSNLFVSLVV